MAMILTIDPSEDLAEIVKRLKNAKLKVSSVLDGLHIVTLDADRSVLAKVRSMPGVIGAVADEIVHLDPKEKPYMGPNWPRPADQVTVPEVTGMSWRSPAWDKGGR